MCRTERTEPQQERKFLFTLLHRKTIRAATPVRAVRAYRNTHTRNSIKKVYYKKCAFSLLYYGLLKNNSCEKRAFFYLFL